MKDEAPGGMHELFLASRFLVYFWREGLHSSRGGAVDSLHQEETDLRRSLQKAPGQNEKSRLNSRATSKEVLP